MTSDLREASRRLPAAERRRAIVRAALRVFSSTSYAGATTAEIAREAGVSEPVLYRHFASKRALQEHLVAYLRAWNQNPTPFEWTKPARAIIKSHKRMLDRISTAVH